MILAITAIATSPTARAETTPGLIGYDPEHITVIGTFRPNGYHEQMLCIDARQTNPTRVTEVIKENSPFVAYAAYVYQQTTDPNTAAAYAVAVGRKINTNVAAIEAAIAALPGETRAIVSAKADAITTEANNFRGPYKLPLKLSGAADNFNATGTIGEIGVKAEGNGKWVPGLRGTVTLTNATFGDGKTTKSITTTNKPQSLDFSATANGKVEAKLRIDEIPPVEILVHGPQAAGYQRVMINVKPVPAATTDSLLATVDWQPTISTALKEKIVSSGSRIVDVATARNGRPNAKFTGRFDFFTQSTQPVESRAIPEGLTPFASVKFESQFGPDGESSKIVAEATAPPGGSKFFTVVATIDPDESIGLKGYTSKWGEEPETGRILDIAVSTKASSQKAGFGTSVHDTWSIGQVVDRFGDQELTYIVQPTLYGPLARENGKCPTGEAPWQNAPIERQWAAKRISWAGVATDDHYLGVISDDTLTVTLGQHSAKTADACYSFGGTLTVQLGETVVTKVSHPAGSETQGFFVPAEVGDEINAGQSPATTGMLAIISTLIPAWIARRAMI